MDDEIQFIFERFPIKLIYGVKWYQIDLTMENPGYQQGYAFTCDKSGNENFRMFKNQIGYFLSAKFGQRSMFWV